MNPWAVANDPPPEWGDFQKMAFSAQVFVNRKLVGNDARATAFPVLAATGTTQYFALDTDLRKGDSVELSLYQTVESEVTATGFLEIRRLGPTAISK
jgi:hypothetical protein